MAGFLRSARLLIRPVSFDGMLELPLRIEGSHFSLILLPAGGVPTLFLLYEFITSGIRAVGK